MDVVLVKVPRNKIRYAGLKIKVREVQRMICHAPIWLWKLIAHPEFPGTCFDGSAKRSQGSVILAFQHTSKKVARLLPNQNSIQANTRSPGHDLPQPSNECEQPTTTCFPAIQRAPHAWKGLGKTPAVS